MSLVLADPRSFACPPPALGLLDSDSNTSHPLMSIHGYILHSRCGSPRSLHAVKNTVNKLHYQCEVLWIYFKLNLAESYRCRSGHRHPVLGLGHTRTAMRPWCSNTFQHIHHCYSHTHLCLEWKTRARKMIRNGKTIVSKWQQGDKITKQPFTLRQHGAGSYLILNWDLEGMKYNTFVYFSLI